MLPTAARIVLRQRRHIFQPRHPLRRANRARATQVANIETGGLTRTGRVLRCTHASSATEMHLRYPCPQPLEERTAKNQDPQHRSKLFAMQCDQLQSGQTWHGLLEYSTKKPAPIRSPSRVQGIARPGSLKITALALANGHRRIVAAPSSHLALPAHVAAWPLPVVGLRTRGGVKEAEGQGAAHDAFAQAAPSLGCAHFGSSPPVGPRE